MALLQNVIAEGTHAARPTAGSAGVLYWESDTGNLFRDNGSSWEQIAASAIAPAARVHNSGSESITNSTYTTLTFDSTDKDEGTTGAQHSTSTNTSRLTCQVAGLYLITVNVTWASNATGYREVFLQKNGTTVIADLEHPASNGAATCQCLTTLAVLAVNDYVEVLVFMNAGVSLNILGANGQPNFGWVRVSS